MKRFFTLFAAAALCLSLSVSALAMPSDKKPGKCQELREAQEKFQSLSDKEKSAIYKLDEKLVADQKALISAYEKYGVIDSDAAEKLTTALNKGLEKAKTDGVILPGSLPLCPGTKGEKPTATPE
jgi:hypothetical protein